MSIKEHRNQAKNIVKIGVVSVSSTRSIENDESGKWIVEKATSKGFFVLTHTVVIDKTHEIRKQVLKIINNELLDVIILTGGTGITNKDVTIEALSPLFSKTMYAFSSLFAKLSYKEIGSAAILSRTRAGILGKTVIFCIPGSKKACKLACNKLIFPELRHIILHLLEK